MWQRPLKLGRLGLLYTRRANYQKGRGVQGALANFMPSSSSRAGSIDAADVPHGVVVLTGLIRKASREPGGASNRLGAPEADPHHAYPPRKRRRPSLHKKLTV